MANLRTAVGEVKTNHAADVKYAQYLLADWRLRIGGVPLVIDGICGPLTRAAIKEFQRTATKVVDGRMDVDGPSIRTLEYMHVMNTLSGIRPIDYLAAFSQMRLPLYNVELGPAAARYLTALRARFG